MTYKDTAKEGVQEIVEEVRPQAEEQNDEEVLQLCDDVESYMEDDKAIRGVKKLRELKNACEEKGYSIDIS